METIYEQIGSVREQLVKEGVRLLKKCPEDGQATLKRPR